MAAAKPYSGRLAFDSESGFHLSEDGKPVVTDDGGQTWRYAGADDTSHLARYHQRTANIDSTANKLLELSIRYGEDQAAQMVDPHHYEVQPDDPHYDEGADEKTNLMQDPDDVAATIASHTESA